MSSIENLWVAMVTSDRRNSGTDSPIFLIINTRSGLRDDLHYTFPGTAQRDQERGQANLYEITRADFAGVDAGGNTFDTLDLNPSSIRLGVRGDDQWRPQSVFIWGVDDTGVIIPFALNTNMEPAFAFALQLSNVELSSDPDEGDTSFAPTRVERGSGNTPMHRLLMVVSTANANEAGTDDRIRLQIMNKAGMRVVDHAFGNTSQDDFDKAQANFYFVPVLAPFSRNDLMNDSIQLIIEGDDAWLPDRLFLFGLDTDNLTVKLVYPLVHLPTWPLGSMSTDAAEGAASVTLPLFNAV